MDFSYDKQMGSRIRLLREARHLTQEQLAAKLQVQGCDITRSALAKIEVGQRHLYAREIKLLHEILQVPYDDLLGQMPKKAGAFGLLPFDFSYAAFTGSGTRPQNTCSVILRMYSTSVRMLRSVFI